MCVCVGLETVNERADSLRHSAAAVSLVSVRDSKSEWVDCRVLAVNLAVMYWRGRP